MDILTTLRRERRPRRLYRLHFAEPALEAEFHGWQRRRYRPARTILFLVFGAAAALTPLFDVLLFDIDADAQALLRALHWQLMLPLAIVAAVASHLSHDDLRRALKTAAILAMWSAMLLLRWVALNEHFNYPSHLLGLSMISVALFCGFFARRVVLGCALFGSIAIAIEWFGAQPHSQPALQTYSLLLMLVVAIGGAFTHELMSRLAWLNRRHSEVLAATDGLTGLANHYEFHRSLERVLAQAAREQKTIGVALLDLDHFKSINDGYGHLFGDRVLREVGVLLRAHVARRPFDLRARYGGEEMAIVWYDVKVQALPGLVEDVLDAIRNLPFSDPRTGLRVRVTASAGLCWLVPNEQTRAEDVLHAADLLLYSAKSEGRNRGRLAPFDHNLPSVNAVFSPAYGEERHASHAAV